MRSLLTGYAGAFNRRHRRSGHLFQNRYKSIVCEENVYFLELVRYLHLNPLRAGVVRDLAALDGYGYTGHSTLMGRTPRPWQNTREVLGRFSPRLGPARRAYRLFVSEGVVQGRRPDLIGGGLVRSVGGWKAVEELRRGREEYTSDERVLGGAEFVEDLMKRLEKEGDNKARLLKREPLEISHWVRKVCEATGVREEALSGPGRRSEVCLAREGLAYVWVEALGRSGRELAGVLNIRPESVYKAAKRGKEDRKRWEKMAGWN
jgi:hypothetical protein